jgi:hypothetical protein
MDSFSYLEKTKKRGKIQLMAIRNRISAFVYRLFLLGFALATLAFLFLDEEENGNYFEGLLYFDTEITLLAAVVVLAELIANGIGLAKDPRGLAPGVYSPLSLAATAYEGANLLAYPIACLFVGNDYFAEGRFPPILFAHLLLPLFFIADWALFGEKGTVKWRYGLYWLLYPLFFFAFHMVRHAISNSAVITCPLFDATEFTSNAALPAWFAGNGGWNGVIFSSLSVLGLFAAVSYGLIFVNNLLAGKYFQKKSGVQ